MAKVNVDIPRRQYILGFVAVVVLLVVVIVAAEMSQPPVIDAIGA
jgi:hypothetical protein